MSQNNLKEMLDIFYNTDYFEAAILKKIDFDLGTNKIVMVISIYHSSHTENYSMIFQNVSSFYFINDSGERRFKITNFESFEKPVITIHSINFYPDGIGKIDIHSSNDAIQEQCYSSANFMIEFDLAVLFIEAEKLVINDTEYHVGFPSKTVK